MVDEKEIKKWLDDGTIDLKQAEKMLADYSMRQSEEKSGKFVACVALIGVILILIGGGWLFAKNWQEIPDAAKVVILVSATLASYVSGFSLRRRAHEILGRGLIAIGAVLFIISLFLISQIYHLASTGQDYAWLLFMAWTIVLVSAYRLDSQENVVISMLTFVFWLFIQYTVSLPNHLSWTGTLPSSILIFLSTGALLFGVSSLHSSFKHRFTNIYRFWMALYVLLIFHMLSYQSILPAVSEYPFGRGVFTAFLGLFIFLCFLGFIGGTLYAQRSGSVSSKEIIGFVGVLAILFMIILAARSGAGLTGSCNKKDCYDINTTSECASPPDQLVCQWEGNRCKPLRCIDFNTSSDCNTASDQLVCQWMNNKCDTIECSDFHGESECADAPPKLNCNWKEYYCSHRVDSSTYELCRSFDNQREDCTSESACVWKPSLGFGDNMKGLPTRLWVLWIINNFVYIGVIIATLRYGQMTGSTKIVNLAIFTFILYVISRYLSFWAEMKGYVEFSVLAILGGILLILGAWFIPKFRRDAINKTKKPETP